MVLSNLLLNILRQVSDLQPTTTSEVATRFTDLSEDEAKKSLDELHTTGMIINNNGRFYTSYEGEGLAINA